MKVDNCIYSLLYDNGKKLIRINFYYYRDLLIYVKNNDIKNWRCFIEKVFYY